METVNSSTTDVFGLYELSSDGTVLYSRAAVGVGMDGPSHAVIGRDFFYEIFPCQNIAELRSHFRRFITGDRSVDTFHFDWFFEREVVRAKVCLTRAYENDHDHANGIVIMDIKRAV